MNDIIESIIFRAARDWADQFVTDRESLKWEEEYLAAKARYTKAIEAALAPAAGPEALFRVIREEVDGQTVRVLLEPYKPGQQVEVSEGDEFVTGTLNSDPWEKPHD